MMCGIERRSTQILAAGGLVPQKSLVFLTVGRPSLSVCLRVGNCRPRTNQPGAVTGGYTTEPAVQRHRVIGTAAGLRRNPLRRGVQAAERLPFLGAVIHKEPIAKYMPCLVSRPSRQQVPGSWGLLLHPVQGAQSDGHLCTPPPQGLGCQRRTT